MKKIKFKKEWRYSINGSHVLTAKPGDIIQLPDVLAEAAINDGFAEILKAKPAAAKTAKPKPTATKTAKPAAAK